MGRITVLRIITRLNVGGPAQQITGLLAGLDEDRFEHLVAVGRPDAGEGDWIELRAPWLADDPRIVRVPGLVRPVRPAADRRAYRQLRALIRRIRPDVVHTHTSKAGLLGRAAARREGVPALVHTYHGHVLQGYLGKASTMAVRLLERRLAARTDVLLAVGERVRNDLLAAGIGTAERYVVVPPGVAPPLEYDQKEARAALGLDPDVPVVASVARVTASKRVDRLIAVADEVARHRPDTVVLVAGAGSDDALGRLRAAVRYADVRWLGWVADVGIVHAAADVILSTSDTDGMPVALIEAGMCGRACVATDVDSVGEVVLDGRTGRVVPRDVTALAEAVIELLNDPSLRARYGAAAREHSHATFGMQQLVASTERVYLQALATRR